jgi:hypothetical protein
MTAPRKGRVAITVTLGLLLAACSAGPSNGDVEKAVKASHAKGLELATKLGGSVAASLVPKLHSVKKVSCAEVKDSTAFVCDVELDTENALLGRSKTVSKMHFVKGSDGWMLANG